MPSSKPFVWDGDELATMADIWKVVAEIATAGAPYMATEFLDAYGQWIDDSGDNPENDGRWVAKQNIGYYAGYYDADIRRQVYEIFEVDHPIFGYLDPTPEEAFEKGKEWGQAIKDGRSYP